MPDEPTQRPPLGRRPPKNAPAVDATPFLLAGPQRRVTVAHPATFPPPAIRFPMNRNDQAGVCVVASFDHYLRCVAYRLGVSYAGMSDGQLLADYQTQNPDFRGWADGGTWRDGGMDMQTYLEHLVATGRIVAFGRVLADELVLKPGIYVGQALQVGAYLDEAQADQFDAGQPWDYVATSPEWGGHAFALDGYDPDHVDLVTWGAQTSGTDAFVAHQVEEAWFILTRWHLEHPPADLDLAGFAEAVAEITAGKVVVPAPAPDPTPDPPPPAPDPAPAGCLTAAPKEAARGLRTALRRVRYGWG